MMEGSSERGSASEKTSFDAEKSEFNDPEVIKRLDKEEELRREDEARIDGKRFSDSQKVKSSLKRFVHYPFRAPVTGIKMVSPRKVGPYFIL